MRQTDESRIPWPPRHVAPEVFNRITRFARDVDDDDDDLFIPTFNSPLEQELLDLLEDCEYGDGMGAAVGATYKQLALIGHLVGMDPEQRRRWYATSERIGLTQRHSGHIIARIQDGTLYRLREAASPSNDNVIPLADRREAR